MKIFYAGADASPRYNAVLRESGAINRLESFYYLLKKDPSKFENYLLDSGGFTARKAGIEIKVEKFADFLNKNEVKFAFNLDTNNLDETLKNQEFLIGNTNTYIIPIYHYSDYCNNRDLLDEFLKFPYISVGGLVSVGVPDPKKLEFLNYVFKRTGKNIKVHGLGQTDVELLKLFPFYSVDSTSWLSMARFGRSQNFKVSDIMQAYLAKDRHYVTNCKMELNYWLNIEKIITKLWNKLGYPW